MRKNLNINREFLLNLASALVRINTENPPGREVEAASFLAETMADFGIKSFVDRLDGPRANAICILEGKGDGPTILFNSHLDTVPVGVKERWSVEPLSGCIKDGRLYGRGAADAKGSVASMAAALSVLSELRDELKGRIIFAAVADEEVAGIGTKALLSKYKNIDFAIVGEPTELKVCTAQKGRMEFLIKVLGKSSHASMPNLGINAITAAAELCLALEKHSIELSKSVKHPLLGFATLAVTMINGGLKPNIIPDECRITLDRRIIPNEDIEDIKSSLQAIASSIESLRHGVSISIYPVSYHPAAEVSPDNPFVKAALDTTSEIIQSKALPSGFPAYTDLSWIFEKGIPGVILGPGSLSQAHAYDEYVTVEELYKAAEIYTKLAIKLLSY